VSVDGSDFQITQPFPHKRRFSPQWFSNMFKRLGLRYEIAVSILNGDIVWINGPFVCGLFNDLAIFHIGLKQQLSDKECVEEDDGYSGDDPSHVKTRSGVYHLEGGVKAFEILFVQDTRL
jgi:hypothetical protein